MGMRTCAMGLQFRRLFLPVYYSNLNLNAAKRNFAVEAKSSEKEINEKKVVEPPPSEPGWMSRLLRGSKIETGTESHSNLLANKDVVYELQFHKVKPDSMDKYLEEYEGLTHIIQKLNTGGEHIGSWTVEVGDLDEVIHLWKFNGGYHTLDKHKQILRFEEEFKEYKKRRNQLLRSRVNQTLLAFSFWSNIQQRPGNNIYELRSYTLKPGTMIDWGNIWARGLKYRQSDHESVAGFFSHIGELYKAHHLWAYESLAAREEVRDMAWEREGWHECVAYTVPLVSSMVSRILIPTSFSPLK